jgi:hypothetical protein
VAKYDLENVLDSIKTFLQANLNTQIAALNTEKNDGITLKTVDSTSYHMQYLQDRADLGDPLVLYGEMDEAVTDMAGGTAASTYRLGVLIILQDNGTDPDIVRRLLRYRRAVADVVSANWASIANENKSRIVLIPPVGPSERLNSGYVGRATGIEFTITSVG